MKLSSVIIAKNEEEKIKDAINSVNFSDEVIVIDDFSEDATVLIAQKFGAKVFKRHLNGDFSGQRNFGLRQAQAEWVLFIDADESLTTRLKNEIIQAINDPLRNYSAYFLKRQDFFVGKKLNYGEVGGAKFIRLAKRGSGRWERGVHEKWSIDGKVGFFKNPILHYAHPTLKSFIKDVNFTSSLHAEANKKEGKKSSLFKIIFWPKFKFFTNYFLKAGFLDGTHGFVLALLMTFHSFLAWSKLWFLQKNSQKSL